MLVWVPFEEMFDYMLTCGTPEVHHKARQNNREGNKVEEVWREMLGEQGGFSRS